ncbi:MAG: DoxX family protein [Planctomycetia bacterium]|nr:DoxX family protein [Planctomycetia bacterium]
MALRVAIGWLFFAGACEKYANKSFSSAPFLKQAKGPLAPLYQAGLPDVHGWNQEIEKPRQQVSNPYEKFDPEASPKEAQEKARGFVLEAYQPWQDQIVKDWGQTQQAAGTYYRFDDKQQKKAADLFLVYRGKLTSFLASKAEDLAGYRHDLYRMTLKQPQPELPTDPDMDTRKAAAGAVRSWVEDTERQYRADLIGVATSQQLKDRGELPVEETTLHKFDRFLIYSHFAIGICLLIGLLTRLASLGAALFLLSVVATQPPWIAGSLSWTGPQAVMYQVIMMCACLVLMTVGAGRWMGLDYFFGCRKCADKTAVA